LLFALTTKLKKLEYDMSAAKNSVETKTFFAKTLLRKMTFIQSLLVTNGTFKLDYASV